MTRAQEEKRKEAERVASSLKRKEQRAAEVKPINKFIRSKGLSIVHESSTPPKEDSLAEMNPLSLKYGGRRKRKQKVKQPSPSPEPDEELEEEAAKKGIKLVSKHKEKRQKQGEDAASAIEKAKEALKLVPPDVARSLLEDAAAGSSTTLVQRAPVKKKAQPGADKRRVATPMEKDAYFEKQLADINKVRDVKKKGRLNAASRKFLRSLCDVHVNDAVQEGFAGSALGSTWITQFTNDYGKHPAATSDVEAESDEGKQE